MGRNLAIRLGAVILALAGWPGKAAGLTSADAVFEVTNTPEPTTMTLLALGLVGLAAAGYLRRRRGARP
jgi:MYXO-CTERM domain-containing protein